MYRVLLIDLWSGQGANPDTPRVLYETDNKANALHVLAFIRRSINLGLSIKLYFRNLFRQQFGKQ